MIKCREFSEKEKTHLLKVATSITKKIMGKGPKNIFINYLGDEISIHASGIMTNFEKHLIECAKKRVT